MNLDKVKWRKTWLKYLNGINKMHTKLFENDKREVIKCLENDWKWWKMIGNDEKWLKMMKNEMKMKKNEFKMMKIFFHDWKWW